MNNSNERSYAAKVTSATVVFKGYICNATGEVNSINNGKSFVAKTSLCTTEFYNGTNTPTYHNLVAYGHQKSNMAHYLADFQKGEFVEVECKIQESRWEDKKVLAQIATLKSMNNPALADIIKTLTYAAKRVEIQHVVKSIKVIDLKRFNGLVSRSQGGQGTVNSTPSSVPSNTHSAPVNSGAPSKPVETQGQPQLAADTTSFDDDIPF